MNKYQINLLFRVLRMLLRTRFFNDVRPETAQRLINKLELEIMNGNETVVK